MVLQSKGALEIGYGTLETNVLNYALKIVLMLIVCVCAPECMCHRRLAEGVRSPGPGVTGSCKQPSMAIGTSTLVF